MVTLTSPSTSPRDTATQAEVQGRALRARLTGAEWACEALLANGVTTLFGYPGGAALPFYRHLAKYADRLRHILVRHEQNAAHAADGYARATGKVGVCVATSGPGATNLLTGIATAYMDCVPLVAVTGQVATAAIGTQAFQEVDVVGMVGPITKAAFQVRTVEEIPSVFAAAFRIAREGRPGPVLVDLPKDVQMATCEGVLPALGSEQGPPSSAVASPPATTPNGADPFTAQLVGAAVRGRGLAATPVGADPFAVQQAVDLLNAAERPLVIAGHGVVMAGAADALRALAEAANLPVGTTLLGLGAFPERHPQALGMVGMHGTVAANLAMHHADVILGVGMRFDDRVVGRARDFAPNARIIHVDVDPTAFGRVVRADVPLLADAGVALKELAPHLDRPRDRSAAWWQRLLTWKAEHAACGAVDEETEAADGLPTSPEVVKAVRRVTGGAGTVVADIGQHQMFVALHHGFERPGQLLTSGGLGTMGYAVPAAMGVKAADPGRPVWAVVGDGGFQMSAPEISTLVASRLAVKVVIVNNGCLGMVRQWQELFYDNVYSQSILPQPDFAALARAHGCWAETVTRRADLEQTLREAALHPGPAVVDVRVPMEETVFPMVPAGASPGEIICQDPVNTTL